MNGHRAKERLGIASSGRRPTHHVTAAGLMTGALMPLAATAAWALPEGGTVAAGSATVSTPTATSMRVDQTTDRAILDWTRFNIAANESVHFQQPNAASIALNRVSGQEPSAIFGSLSANGQIFLLNPSGILFGASSRVDVGALTASTLTMSNQDFLNSQYRFTHDPAAANAAVINQGVITAGPGGYVALLGAAARNEGMIQAQLGSIALASGKAATLDMRGDGLIQFVITDAVSGSVTGPDGTPLASAVSNTGTLQADGGMVTLHAKAAAGLVRSVVNQDGVVRATSLVNHGGVIKLIAEGDHGTVSNTGTLDVSAGGANAIPGAITMHSDQAINLAGTVTADAGAIALSAPEIQSAADISAGVVTLQATDLTLTGGSVTAATGTLDVAHAFTHTGGSLAPGAATITVGGNWTHAGGSFEPGTSTVVFTDATQASRILGENTFYNVRSVTPDKELFFEAGATQTVLGAFTITGIKAHLIDLRSTDPGGGQWRLDPRGAVDVQFVHLGDALNLRPTLIKALPSNSYGNNTGWDTDPIWTAVGPGNWSTDANWDTGVRPGAADTVTFDATSVTDSTVDAGFAGTIANLNINAGYTGTIDLARSLTISSAFTQAAGTFNGGSSAMTVTGAFTLSGGTFTSTSGTLTVGGNWTHTAGGTFTHNSGTVVPAGTNNRTWDVNSTETFNNLTVNMGGSGYILAMAAGDTFIVGGTLTHTNGVINTGTIQAQAAVAVGAGADGGSATVQITSAGAQTIEGNGGTLPSLQVSKPSGALSLGTTNITVRDLTIDTGNTLTSTIGTLTVEGNWTNTAGGTFNHNTGAVVAALINAKTWDVNGTETFNTLTVNTDGSGYILTIGSGDTLIVGGTFTHTNGYINTGTIAAQGAVTIGALADGGTGLLSFTGTADQTYTQSGNAMDGLVTVNKASGTVTLASAVTWNAASQNLTVTSGTLDLAGFALSTGTLTVAAAGTVLQGAGIITAGNISNAGIFSGGSAAITVSSNVTLTGGTFTSTTGTLTVLGNWTHTAGGTFSHNNGTVNLGNNSIGSVTADVATAETFNNLSISRAISAAYIQTIASGDTLIVLGTLTHASGIINTGTIEARGNVVVGASGRGGTGTMSFLVAGDQTITSGGGLSGTMGININKPSGTVDAGTTDLSIGGFTLSSGIFTSTTGTLYVLGNWTHTAGGTFNHNNGTVQLGNNSLGVWTADVATTEIFNNLSVSMNNSAFYTYTITSGDTLRALGTFTHISGRLLGPGILEAQGNVVIGSTSLGGTGLLSFTGTADQTYTQSGNAMDGLVTVNKASGTVSLASAVTWNAASQNLTVTSGTLDLAGFALSTGTLTLAASGTVLQGAGIITAGSISNAGTFSGGSAAITLSGAVTLTGGTFTSTTGTLTVGGNWTHTAGGTFQHNNGTISARGSANTTWDVNSTETFNNLTVDKPTSAVGITIAAGDTLIVGGTFTNTNGFINTGTVQAQGAVVVASTADGGTATVQITLAGAQTIEGNGGWLPSLQVSKPSGALSLGTTNVSVQNLTIDAGNTLSSTTGTLTVRGDWTNTAGGTFAHSAGTVLASGASDATWDVNGTETFNNLTISKGGSSSLIIASGDTLIVGETFTYSNGFINTGTIEAQGAVTIGSGTDGGTARLSFTGTADQTYTQSGDAMNGLVTVNKASGTVTLASAATWNGSGQNLTVTSGTLDLAGFALSTGTISNAGTFSGGSAAITLTGSVTLTGGTFTSTSGTLTVGGAWTHTAGGTFSHNTGTVLASGVSATWDVTGTETFNNLTVAKTGGQTLTIASGDTLIVGGTFTHTDGLISTGTIAAQGAVTIGALADAGTGLLSFTGTADQTYTQSGNAMDGLVTVNKASGTVTLASAVTWNAASQNLTVTSGTLDANGQTATVAGLTSVTGGTYVASTATQTLNGGLTVSSGTFTGSSGTVDVNGAFNQSNGTVTASSGSMSVFGDFIHSGGTFTHNSGTVTLDGTDQTMSGSTTFNNLAKAESSNNATDSILTFAAGTTQTILGTWTLDGLDADDRINLVSSTPGTQWQIDPQGTRTIDYLDVQDSYNINSTWINAIGTNSTNGGNNSGWSFAAPADLALSGLSQTGFFLLGATPEGATLLTAGILPDYIYRCLDQDRKAVVCTAGAVWHDDDGTNGALSAEAVPAHEPTHAVARASMSAARPGSAKTEPLPMAPAPRR